MAMSFEGQVLDALVSLGEADQATVLAAAAPLGLKAIDAVLAVVTKEDPAIGAVLSAFAPQVISALGGEEAVLYSFLLGKVKAYAALHGG